MTKIEYSLPHISGVSLIIYDSLGIQVEILHNGIQHSGNYSISWDAAQYSNGIYYIRMISDQYVHTQKLMLIK